jgi:hypothetical protein
VSAAKYFNELLVEVQTPKVNIPTYEREKTRNSTDADTKTKLILTFVDRATAWVQRP